MEAIKLLSPELKKYKPAVIETKPLVIQKVKKGGFHEYMKSIGKFGGQNKIPQLSDNRKIANVLEKFLEN